MYTFLAPNFFPSKPWYALGRGLSRDFAVIAALAFYWGFYKGVLKFQRDYGRLVKAAVLLFAPFWMYGIFWSGLGLGLGHAWTRAAGAGYTQTVAAHMADKPRESRSSRKNTRCIESPDLIMPLFSELCIPEARAAALPREFLLQMSGRKSYFGLTVESYRFYDGARLLGEGAVGGVGKGLRFKYIEPQDK
jgi:hypothetical protein